MRFIRCKIGSAGMGFPVIRAENDTVELIDKFSLRNGLFDDNTHICLQNDNLPAKMTMLSNMGSGVKTDQKTF